MYDIFWRGILGNQKKAASGLPYDSTIYIPWQRLNSTFPRPFIQFLTLSLERSTQQVVVEAPSEESSLTEAAAAAATTSDCSALLSYSSFADCHRVRVGESACRDGGSAFVL